MTNESTCVNFLWTSQNGKKSTWDSVSFRTAVNSVSSGPLELTMCPATCIVGLYDASEQFLVTCSCWDLAISLQKDFVSDLVCVCVVYIYSRWRNEYAKFLHHFGCSTSTTVVIAIQDQIGRHLCDTVSAIQSGFPELVVIYNAVCVLYVEKYCELNQLVCCSYNMVGHTKFCLTLLGGYIFFHDPLQALQLLGIFLTFSGKYS